MFQVLFISAQSAANTSTDCTTTPETAPSLHVSDSVRTGWGKPAYADMILMSFYLYRPLLLSLLLANIFSLLTMELGVRVARPQEKATVFCSS